MNFEDAHSLVRECDPELEQWNALCEDAARQNREQRIAKVLIELIKMEQHIVVDMVEELLDNDPTCILLQKIEKLLEAR